APRRIGRTRRRRVRRARGVGVALLFAAGAGDGRDGAAAVGVGWVWVRNREVARALDDAAHLPGAGAAHRRADARGGVHPRAVGGDAGSDHRGAFVDGEEAGVVHRLDAADALRVVG